MTVNTVDTTIRVFNHSVSFFFPSFWNASQPTPNLDMFCLAMLNETNWWGCVKNSSLTLLKISKRDAMSSASAIHASGNALTPGSYTVMGKYLLHLLSLSLSLYYLFILSLYYLSFLSFFFSFLYFSNYF